MRTNIHDPVQRRKNQATIRRVQARLIARLLHGRPRTGEASVETWRSLVSFFDEA